jgi:hypothetical protein
MRRAVQQGSDHLSERRCVPVESTERGGRGRTDRRASFDLTEVSDNLAEGREPLDKRDAT